MNTTTNPTTPTLALIGAGNWGKNLARNFHALGVLHTICDSRQSLLDTYSTQFPDVQLTSDFQSVLNNPKITQVAIAAPAALHYRLTKQALLAGKDVYVEKPLCLDSAEGEELIVLAESHGRILMVGHLLQYHPCVQRLQEIVAKGELGKLQYITSNRLNLGSIRTEENALWSFAPHDVSVILSLCGNHLPQSVRCTGGAYLSKGIADTTLTTMHFENDVRAHIYVSWLHPFKEQKLIVIGSKGMAVFDDTKPWEEKLVIFKDYVQWNEGNIPKANKSEGQCVEVPYGEPLREECAHFVECCRIRRSPRTHGAEGLRVLQVLQAAQTSLNADGEIKNPLEQHAMRSVGSDFFAHSSSVIDPKAKIGSGSKIWHFSHIMAEATLGERCNIGQNVVVSSDVTLGNNVKVQNNVSIYTGVHCEDDVFLGPSMVFTNVNNPRSAVNRRGEYQATYLRKGSSVGANATIVCGNELGEYCFIGAGAVVTKDVKPYALIVGNPGRQIGWMSRHGEKLSLPVKAPQGQVMTAACPVTGEIYRLEDETLTWCEQLTVQTVGDL